MYLFLYLKGRKKFIIVISYSYKQFLTSSDVYYIVQFLKLM